MATYDLNEVLKQREARQRAEKDKNGKKIREKYKNLKNF